MNRSAELNRIKQLHGEAQQLGIPDIWLFTVSKARERINGLGGVDALAAAVEHWKSQAAMEQQHEDETERRRRLVH